MIGARYPEDRHIYANKVGDIGERAICLVLSQYLPDRPGTNVKGADITLAKHDIGIEEWNHSEAHSYVERAKSVVANLSIYKHKFLVASFISDGIRSMMEQNDIKVLTYGFQILPAKQNYFHHYFENNLLEGKRFLTPLTLRILAKRLAPIWKIIGVKNTVTYGDSDTHVCNRSLTPIEPSLSSKCPSTTEHNKPTINRIHRNSPTKLSRLTENRALSPRLLEPQNNIILNLLGTMLFLLPIYTMSNHFSRRFRETAIVMFTFLILQIIKLLRIKQVNLPILRAHYTKEQKPNTSGARSITPTSNIMKSMIEFYAAKHIVNSLYHSVYRWSNSIKQVYDTHYHRTNRIQQNNAPYHMQTQFVIDRSLMVFINSRLTLGPSFWSKADENQMPSVWNHRISSTHREELLQGKALSRLQEWKTSVPVS